MLPKKATAKSKKLPLLLVRIDQNFAFATTTIHVKG